MSLTNYLNINRRVVLFYIFFFCEDQFFYKLSSKGQVKLNVSSFVGIFALIYAGCTFNLCTDWKILLQACLQTRVRETFELNQLKSAPSQLLPVFPGFDRLQTGWR